MATTREILELVHRRVGEQEVKAAQADLDRLAQEAAQADAEFKRGIITEQQYAAALRKVSQEARAAQSAMDQTSRTMGMGAGAASAMAGGVYQLANLMEDAQFGARALGNNLGMLVATFTKFHPVGMAVGGVLQVLTAVFRDQIDAMLDSAGILDKNLSPSAKKAKEEMEGLASAFDNLKDANPKLQGFVASVQQAMEAIKGGPGEKALLNQIIVDNNLLDAQIQEATRQAGDAGAAVAEKIREGGFGEFLRQVGLYVTGRNAQKQADDNLAKAQDDQLKAAQSNLQNLAKDAQKSDEKLLEFVQALREAGEQAGDKNLLDLADNLERQSDAFAKAAAKASTFAQKIDDANENQKELNEQIRKARGENEKLVDDLNRRAEAEQKAAQAAIDANRRVEQAKRQGELSEAAGYAVAAMGPGYQGQVQARLQQYLGATDRAGNRRFTDQQARQNTQADVIRDLTGRGLNPEIAVEAAGAIFEQAANQTEKLIMALDLMLGGQRAAAQRMGVNDMRVNQLLQQARQQAIRWNAQQAWHNNRPNGF